MGFDRDRNRRQRELTNNINQKGEYHNRFFFKNIFGFGEHQEKGTFGLCYKVTLTRNSGNFVLNEGDATNLG